ncbi:MAG TPA: hypothetical protein VII33_19345, partial [Nakamurella sp.]
MATRKTLFAELQPWLTTFGPRTGQQHFSTAETPSAGSGAARTWAILGRCLPVGVQPAPFDDRADSGDRHFVVTSGRTKHHPPGAAAGVPVVPPKPARDPASVRQWVIRVIAVIGIAGGVAMALIGTTPGIAG